MALSKRQRYCLICLLTVSAVAVSCNKKQASDKPVAQETGKSAAPIISAAEPVFDFGQVKQGTEVSHIYKIKNTGNKELVIEKTKGS